MSSASRSNDDVISQAGGHEATFTSPTIHFTMTSHAHGEINLGAAVRRLLRADLAIAAAWPSESGLRVTPRLRALAKSMKKVHRLQNDFQSYQEQRTPMAFINFAIRYPRIAIPSPFVRSINQNENDPQDDGASSFTGVLDALTFGQEVLAEAQKVAAVERVMDASLFGGKSRTDDEFVRLNLRGSYHYFALPHTSETFKVVFEPRLMLRRSGIVQLTIAISINRQISTTQLVTLARSDRAVLIRSEIPEPLLAGLPDNRIMGDWSEELDAGARLRVMDFNEPYVMADILTRHLEAAGSIIGEQLPNEWNTHATVIAGAGSCCNEQEDWSYRHELDIARVANRVESRSPINSSPLKIKNLAIFSDHVLHTNLGSSTRIQLEGDPPPAIEELNTVLIIEHALMQYFQLRKLEMALNERDLYGAKLEKVQRTAIRVFSDMRQQEIRHGTAREIVRELLNDLGGEEMRRTIESGLNLAVQANATRAAAVQSQRSLRLTIIATVLASLVAIPTLSDLLERVSGLDPTSGLGRILFPLRWVATLGDWGPWIVVAGLLVLLILMITGSYIRRACTGLLGFLGNRIRNGGPKLPAEFTMDIQRYEEFSLYEQDEA